MAEITNKNIGEFIKAYEKAKGDEAETFTFHGENVLVAYAKHVIEYFKLKGYPK